MWKLGKFLPGKEDGAKKNMEEPWLNGNLIINPQERVIPNSPLNCPKNCLNQRALKDPIGRKPSLKVPIPVGKPRIM